MWLADKHQRFVVILPSHDTATLSSDLTSGKLEPHASAGNRVLFRGNIGISSGVHYWEVGVQACNHGSLFVVLIASSQITSSEGWGDFGFVSYGVRWSQVEGEHLYGLYFSAGDTIGVRFDLEQATLSFTKDGDDFTRGRPAPRYESPVANGTAMYHTFISRGEFTPQRSRGGILVELTNADFDKTITRLHGIDRFSLRHGEAIVLGEKDGVVWYVIQGDEAAGAWYWTDPEVAHLLTLNPSEVGTVELRGLHDAKRPQLVQVSDLWYPSCNLDEDQAARRLSLLLAWNSKVQLLLPFLDFHGQHLLESPISGTANRLTHLRHLIFERHKSSFGGTKVDITTTHTRPPSDEYERPDSLREMPVNRIVALDEPVSFATSVFGQLHKDKFIVNGTASHFFGQIDWHGHETSHYGVLKAVDRKDLGAVDTMLMRELHDLECLGDAEVGPRP
ncbi:hypothetical protein B5M09_012546 [Aphanomyces astaci]|uniref:B30.2/SPRY domain-containing protein n=1 Tax=Aphanomyces astaci TaxID=112090 RepID=A0A425DQ31_APHAT|nr:hypothetical protein B5M09_012546 [Aphanomyces astaci]